MSKFLKWHIYRANLDPVHCVDLKIQESILDAICFQLGIPS